MILPGFVAFFAPPSLHTEWLGTLRPVSNALFTRQVVRFCLTWRNTEDVKCSQASLHTGLRIAEDGLQIAEWVGGPTKTLFQRRRAVFLVAEVVKHECRGASQRFACPEILQRDHLGGMAFWVESDDGVSDRKNLWTNRGS